MPMLQDSSWCPVCNAQTLCARRGTAHLAHFVITLFLCGLWLPVWMLASTFNWCVAWRCQRCGTKV